MPSSPIKFSAGTLTSVKNTELTSCSPSIVIIGPEGGFVPFEIELAISTIAQPIHLGGRTLSVDTAVTTVLAQALPKKQD